MSLGWPGNASESPRKSWRKCLGLDQFESQECLGEDDLQDPAAHHADLLCLWNICSECDTELLSGRGEPEHHTGMDLHHQKGNEPLTFPLYPTVRLFSDPNGPNPVSSLHEGVEVPESQDEHFAGRVQFDKDVLREGRIRLHVSRLRTDDSGLYHCVK
ncbi:hypothetical protein L3Q82_003938 [Scortum barcoo]|uniref:Uncharacterized protein n=1 Tax=Scortum barcoo TaxID=214431 RepID=A0ACB8X9N7_9TELE|nr:hypothetical protein L3Q82_003938 [Scortum barcoo]